MRQVKPYNLDLLVAFGGMLRSIVLASKMCSPGNQSDFEDKLTLNIGHKYSGASISALESNILPSIENQDHWVGFSGWAFPVCP